jgi:hypothetical protein
MNPVFEIRIALFIIQCKKQRWARKTNPKITTPPHKHHTHKTKAHTLTASMWLALYDMIEYSIHPPLNDTFTNSNLQHLQAITMRRALSLAAVGSTLVVASAVEVTFSSIKALNTPVTDKDSWSYKGTITGVPSGFDYVEFVLDNGVELNLSSQRPGSPPAVLLDTVTFDADECKPIRKETGLSCKTDGARVTITEVSN